MYLREHVVPYVGVSCRWCLLRSNTLWSYNRHPFSGRRMLYLDYVQLRNNWQQYTFPSGPVATPYPNSEKYVLNTLDRLTQLVARIVWMCIVMIVSPLCMFSATSFPFTRTLKASIVDAEWYTEVLFAIRDACWVAKWFIFRDNRNGNRPRFLRSKFTIS